MQWCCPHCGINLAISDEKVSAGWSFSRCYKCGGFALIRKAEISVIKVDKAPPGEKVLLPEATENPHLGLVSESANQKLIQHAAPKIKVDKKAPPTTSVPLPTPPVFKHHIAAQKPAPEPLSMNIPKATLPEPLPENPILTRGRHSLSLGIVLAAILAITSGYYLYAQSQTVWKKARQYAAAEQAQLRSEVTDHVQESAMAPVKEPVKEGEEKSAPDLRSLHVKLITKRATLYSGPGTQYSIVGSADSTGHYKVLDWNDRWFKILSQDEPHAKIIGWIPNSLVQAYTDSLNPGNTSGITAPDVNPLHP